MVLMHTQTYLMNKAAENYFTAPVTSQFNVSYQEKPKTFDEISTLEDIYNYLDQVPLYLLFAC